MSQDNNFLENKRKAENNLFDDIKEVENSLDLSKNINPNSNLNCSNIYLIINLFNKYIAFMPYDDGVLKKKMNLPEEKHLYHKKKEILT